MSGLRAREQPNQSIPTPPACTRPAYTLRRPHHVLGVLTPYPWTVESMELGTRSEQELVRTRTVHICICTACSAGSTVVCWLCEGCCVVRSGDACSKGPHEPGLLLQHTWGVLCGCGRFSVCREQCTMCVLGFPPGRGCWAHGVHHCPLAGTPCYTLPIHHSQSFHRSWVWKAPLVAAFGGGMCGRRAFVFRAVGRVCGKGAATCVMGCWGTTRMTGRHTAALVVRSRPSNGGRMHPCVDVAG